MASGMKILLFGDQTIEARTYVRNQLVVTKSDPLLCHFLAQVNIALRHEIVKLSPLEKGLIPTFTNIEELAKLYDAGPAFNVGVGSALLCIAQLADYLE